MASFDNRSLTFSKLMFGTYEMYDGEKLSILYAGLEEGVKLNIFRTNRIYLNNAVQIVLKVDNAFYGAVMCYLCSQS